MRSNHWVAAVSSPFPTRFMTNRESPVARSHRIGLRLYAMALEPIWFFSNGSSTSLRLASSRRSLQHL